MERIRLEEWIPSGGGANGISYYNRGNPDIMLKMGIEDISPENWENELRNARSFSATGLPAPRPGQVVTDGRRYGVVYQGHLDKK